MEDTSPPLLSHQIISPRLVDEVSVDEEQYLQRPGQGPRSNNRRNNNNHPQNNHHPGHSYQNYDNHQNSNSTHHPHFVNNQNNRPTRSSRTNYPNDTQSQNSNNNNARNQNRNNQTRNNQNIFQKNNRNYAPRQNNESEGRTENGASHVNNQDIEQDTNENNSSREGLYVPPGLRSVNNRYQGQDYSSRRPQNLSPRLGQDHSLRPTQNSPRLGQDHHGQDYSPRHTRPTKSDDIGSFGGAPSLRPDPGEAASARQQSNSARFPRAKKTDLKRLTQGHSELTSRMISELLDGTYECMVCVEKVFASVPVWTCKHCFRLFHIGCIRKWRKSSLAQKDYTWVCPHCRHIYTDPPVVSCFCGKCEDAPTFDPYLTPHSCGEVCGKERVGTTCPHTCSLLCHPGPCPDCPALAPEKHCFCGKTLYCKRCGQEDPGQSCGQPCGRLLSCKRHYCMQTCHSGPCVECKLMMTQKCYCGKKEETRVCGSETITDFSAGPEDPRYFSCGKPCGRKLPCGNHFCELSCHPSTHPESRTCPPCTLSPSLVLTCACGALPASQFPPRKSCSDPIPTCDNICGKYLKCGQHKCRRKCHMGPCSEFCDEIVSVPCRCRNVMKQMKCMEVYPDKYAEVVANHLCKSLCVVMRECGKHSCNVPCCPVLVRGMDPDGFHVCRLACPKKLNCGIHLCPLTCHKGKCPQPCLEIVSTLDRVCPCGGTTQYAPVTCGTPLPNCTFNCVTPRTCGHPMTPHLCHWTGNCPPCVLLVNRRCNGGHVMLKSVPCNQVDASCGRECGKPMHCGVHNCTRKCHSGPCEVPLEDDHAHLFPEEVETEEGQPPTIPRPPPLPSCGQRCKKPLPDCNHFCKEACHPGKACPKGLCRQKSKISCACGRLSEEAPCIGQRKIELPCDDVCRKELRSRQLAIAFGILPLSKPPQYSDFLLSMARATPHFIINLETKLNTFLRGADIRLKLPSMDTVQRKTIHELAKYYCLDDESVGSDPVRGVILTKKMGSRLPTALLSQMAAVEDGGTGMVVGGGRPTIRPASTLHLYELSPKVTNYHLENFLRPYEGDYVIQWIDDSNALAIFRHEHVMRKALGSLSGGLFKVKAYQDSNPESGNGNLVLSGISSSSVVPYFVKSPKIPQKSDDVPPDYRQVVKGARVKPEPAPPSRKPWEKDPSLNSFGALSNEFGEEKLLFGDVKVSGKGSEKKSEEISESENEVRENWEDD